MQQHMHSVHNQMPPGRQGHCGPCRRPRVPRVQRHLAAASAQVRGSGVQCCTCQQPTCRLLEIRRFFEDYKKNENKQVLVEDFVGAKAAKEAIIKAMELYEDMFVPKAFSRNTSKTDLAKVAAQAAAAQAVNGASPSKPPLAPAPTAADAE